MKPVCIENLNGSMIVLLMVLEQLLTTFTSSVISTYIVTQSRSSYQPKLKN